MSSDTVCIIKPSHGMKFGPNCIAIGTRVPVEKDGQVLGHAEVVEIRPDAIVLRGVENEADQGVE
jgi:hypothetical protein